MSVLKKFKHAVARFRVRDSQDEREEHRSQSVVRPPADSTVWPVTRHRVGGVVAETVKESNEAIPDNHKWTNQGSRIGNQGNVTFMGNQNLYFASADSQGQNASSVTDSDKSLTESEKNCLAYLRTDAVYGREPKVNAPLDGTLEWFLQENLWHSWISGTSAQVLLMTGRAGCGKSVLALHAMHALAKVVPTKFTICRYFFDGTVASSCDPCFLLRSLIHQMVCLKPKLLRMVRKALDQHGPQSFLTLPILRTVFMKLISHPRLTHTVIIIDAIDECAEHDQETVIEWLSTVIDSAALQPVKIFLTSRPGSLAVRTLGRTPERFTRLRLEDRSEMQLKDIKMFIQQRVHGLEQASICRPNVATKLTNLLQDRADGSFLWVSLATSLLGRRSIIKIHDVEHISGQLPRDLMMLYASLLAQIPEENRDLVAKALRMIVACRRHLEIKELDIMLSLDADHESISQVQENSFLDNAQTLENLLGALVKVVDSRVTLVHHTFREYLISHRSLNQVDRSPMQEDAEHSLDHDIAEVCMRYLLLRDTAESNLQRNPSETSSSPASPITDSTHSALDTPDELEIPFATLFEETGLTTDLMSLYPVWYSLYDYAARFWVVHLEQCQPRDLVHLEGLALQLYQKSHHPSSWFAYHVAINDNTSHHPKHPDTLTLACYFGHTSIAEKIILGQHDMHRFGTACFWAAAMGHVSCLSLLLSCGKGDVCTYDDRNHSALSIAVKNGHLNSVKRLLSSGLFDVNVQVHKGRTPLSLAAGAGNEDLVIQLLAESGIDINLPDSSGASPIFWAIFAESSSTMEKLVRDPRTDLELVDHSTRDTLSYACEYGLADCVRILLDKGVRSKTGDSLGRTPLMYAVLFGDLNTVKQLMRRDENCTDGKDASGRNVISWAAQGRNHEVLKFLLRRDTSGADVEDDHGWAPLAWTMDPPERLDNAMLLLHHLLEDLKTGRWVSFFALALRWRSGKIARMLSTQVEFEINATDGMGRTALAHAAAAGEIELVRQILTRPGVIQTCMDSSGHTAYSLAALHQYQEICDLLQQSR